MESNTLLRIASVSKPITAAAVLQLVSRGKLKLDERIFLDVPDRVGSKTVDPRLRQVTVDHLLRHRAGWDRTKSFDPMFRQEQIAKSFDVPTPVVPNQIIRYMWTQPLDFTPGEKHVYSNFGYSVLGRVVEHVSGKSYEDYVRDEVLAPLGIREMKVGRTRLNDLEKNESRYYPRAGRFAPSVIERQIKDRPCQYGSWFQESLDAHGGWIASAEDLVKFAVAFDRPDDCPLMSTTFAKMMFVPDDVEQVKPDDRGIKRYYAHGWKIVMYADGKFNCYHMGLLEGSQALLVRRNDGLNWAVLFNSDENADKKRIAALVDPLVHRAVNSVKTWPVVGE